MYRAIFAALAMSVTSTFAQAPVPTPQPLTCENYTATNDRGVVQHYEDCTPNDGLVKRCEIIDATDARGKVRKIQNCVRVSPGGAADAPKDGK